MQFMNILAQKMYETGVPATVMNICGQPQAPMSIHKYINSPYSANTQHFRYSANVSSLYCWHKSMSKQVFSKKENVFLHCHVHQCARQWHDSEPGARHFFFKMVGSLLKKHQHERDVDIGTMHCFTALVHFASH